VEYFDVKNVHCTFHLLLQDIRLAHQFEDLVKGDDRFEIVQKVVMGLVCFRLKVSNNAETVLYVNRSTLQV